MFPLRCSVRRCDRPLERTNGGLRCAEGHRFDAAREGYFNLTQPQDRRSKSPGDSDDAVLARQSWINRGHMVGLIETLSELLSEHPLDLSCTRRTIDLGCGEGSFGKALFDDCPETFCGIDLSKRAIRLAARQWPDATWVLANADRVLPFADGTAGRLMSLFGRRPVTEIARVLCDDGQCMIAVPGEEDLIELRELVQTVGKRRSRWKAIVDEFADVGFKLQRQATWRHSVELDQPAITDALAMTYRAVRHSQHSRIQSVEQMNVTLHADLMVFQR
ncbi:putative RNA methyltransferase [Roseiconus lacunae]